MPATVHQIGVPDQGNRVRQNELAAMRAISAAFEELEDNQARERVVRWAAEAFGISLTSPAATQAPPPVRILAAVVDSTLTVDGLDEFFGVPAGRGAHHDLEQRRDTSLEISEADLHDGYAEPPAAAAPVAPVAPAQGVASLLHRFVADFQRLARDWKGAEPDTRRIE
jgi:hypothetical protein